MTQLAAFFRHSQEQKQARSIQVDQGECRHTFVFEKRGQHVRLACGRHVEARELEEAQQACESRPYEAIGGAHIK